MDSFAEVVAAWPSQRELATDIGVTPGHIYQMNRRDSIPSEYWDDLVAAAARREITGVTPTLLMRLAAKRRAA